VNDPPRKESVLKKPPSRVTLSSTDLEALIARVHLSNLAPVDAGVVEQVLRLYAWVAFAIQKASFKMKQLRSLLFGQGRQSNKPPESEASSTSSTGLGQDDGGGEPGPVDEAGLGSEASGREADSGTSGSSPKPKGGHRKGTGRLGAAAYGGAKHTECRHEELEVGRRCPVWGQGTLYELPPGVEIRIDGHAV